MMSNVNGIYGSTSSVLTCPLAASLQLSQIPSISSSGSSSSPQIEQYIGMVLHPSDSVSDTFQFAINLSFIKSFLYLVVWYISKFFHTNAS
jgi:hypothetical protein